MVAQIDREYFLTKPSRIYSRLISYALFEGRPLTTKGRWINPVLFKMFDFLKTVPVKKKINKPIFIVGTGRSGTTILGMLMSMHRDVGFLNEPKALWHSAYEGEDLIGSYTRKPARYRLDDKDVTPEIYSAMHRLFGAYLLCSGTSRVVDKYPELIFRVPFVRAIFPDAKFIFLTRNGWDTCHSIDTWSTRLGVIEDSETHDWWGTDNRKWSLMCEQLVREDSELALLLPQIKLLRNHIDMAAVEWILTMREGVRLRQSIPASVHTVIYERLVESPNETLQALLNFCDLPDDAAFFEYAERILRPAPAKKPYQINPILMPAFTETMVALGYTK